MARFTAADVERIKLMASVGHPATAIARSLGGDRTAEAVRKKCGALGIRLRPKKAKTEVRFWFNDLHLRGLAAEAERRNLTLARLCRLVLETLVRDRLFGAVIDDVPLSRRKVHVPAITIMPPPRPGLTMLLAPQLIGVTGSVVFDGSLAN